VPRKLTIDDEMPRRRRGAGKAAFAQESEHGLAMRIFLYSPKDMIAGAFALAAICAVIINALFLQAGRHPAPMFGTVVTLPAVASMAANPMPRPRPVDADLPLPEAKPADPLTSLVKTTSTVQPASANIPRPQMTVPVSSRVESVPVPVAGPHRVAAVQRALTEYGYGQLKPTGVAGSDTQSAIQKFEKARKLPVTGQVSDRLVRELAAVIGHPIE
jgi:Putative peptidoglycan binding domain